MAEIEFSVLTRQVLDRSFATKEEVQAVVERWKNKQNANQNSEIGSSKRPMPASS